MMFSNKKAINLKKVQEDDPDAYTALMNDAKAAVEHDENTELTQAQTELAQYKNKEARIGIDTQITDYGKKLKVEDTAAEAIKAELSFEDALLKMVNYHVENVKDIEESFNETSSVAAGEDLKDGNEDEPKTFYGAMHMIMERDKITATEASNKAQKEFPKLFAKRMEARNLKEEKETEEE